MVTRETLVRRHLGGELPARTRRARGSRWRTGKPIGNHRDRLAFGAKAFAQRGNLVPDCRFSSTILPCQTRLKTSSLLTTTPDASISAISTSKTRPPSLIRPAAGQYLETVELHHRRQDRGSELMAMIVIDIFKENHRFSN